ncbi:MAG: MTH1187 family thiamine-binding protein [Longimicrobiales bacterium]
MLFGVTVLPMGVDGSIAGPVAEVVQSIEDAKLSYQVNGMSTVVEGEWDQVMPVLHRAEQALHRQYDRVFMMITVDDHEGGKDRLHNSVAEVEARVTPEVPMA